MTEGRAEGERTAAGGRREEEAGHARVQLFVVAQGAPAARQGAEQGRHRETERRRDEQPRDAVEAEGERDGLGDPRALSAHQHE